MNVLLDTRYSFYAVGFYALVAVCLATSLPSLEDPKEGAVKYLRTRVTKNYDAHTHRLLYISHHHVYTWRMIS